MHPLDALGRVSKAIERGVYEAVQHLKFSRLKKIPYLSADDPGPAAAPPDRFRMKHRVILWLLALLPAGAFAQEASPLPPGTIPRDELAADIRADVFRAGINTCPYHYEPAAETPVPRGYKPFYLSHYGRHGARTNWGEVPYGQTLALYDKAAAMGLLTPGGDSIRAQIADIVRRHAGWEGCLTPLGAREHAGIA